MTFGDAAEDRVLPAPPRPPLLLFRFDTEPPDCLFESVFRGVETKVTEPRQYFTAPPLPSPPPLP